MMYEGKNIHCSSTDNKLLCSFSGKLCNQRRLNGYGFCVRHILEDPTAPFKRCVYVAKSSNQMCTQAIPKNEDRRYCNNHMQVLGMLPKKERKKKDNKVISVVSSPSPETGLLLPNGGGAITMKPKFSLSISKDSPLRGLHPSTSVGEPDDPYVFSDTASSDIKPGGLVSIDSVLGKSLQSGTGFVRSASDISTSNAGLGISGGSMIAKYYPELAEKLEKMRAKPEPKASPKVRTKSSRTMNKLQTKIAQNKINEKLRKSQELIQTDSNSSPIQVSSPEAGVIVDQSRGSSPAFSPGITNLSFSPQSSAGHYPPLSSVLGHDQSRRSPEIPPLPQVDTSLLATLATQDNMGFQTMEVECNVNPSSQILPQHTPPRLPPPPYPGSSVLSLPSPLTPSDLPSRAFSPRVSSARHHPPTTTASRSSSSSSTSVSSLPFTPPLSEQQQRSSKIATPLFLSPTSTNPAVLPFPSGLSSGSIDHHHRHHPAPDQVKPSSSHMSSTLDSTSIDILSLLNINHKPLIVDTNSAAQARLPSPNTFAAQLSLPPPPPYVPPKLTVSSSVPSSTLSNSNSNLSSIQPPAPRIKQSVISRPITTVTTASVPHTKLRKVKGILNEKEALQRLKTESAVKYYSFYAKQKISNHNFIGPYLYSSDEDSDDKESEMLPWQPEIFSASSDDQDDEEDDEFDTSIPMSMRPTKLSLMKTRLRRQWHQAQQAFQSNHTVAKGRKQSTLALIRMIRENGGCAVRTLWHITHVKKSKKGLRKMLPKKKKTCCHKSSTDGPCTNPCLPYTNHCLRHVMYNIDQQIFDYCTAKFADNTQCCMPVFDIRHELPLCPIHAAKADNYQKQMEAENKKKPRKKSKPAALTRPPRKGKKKKKGRYARTAKPLPSAETAALDSTLSDVDVLGLDPTPQPEEEHGESDVSTNTTTGVDVAQSASATATITTTTTTTSSSSSSSSSSSTIKPATTTSETTTRLHVTESAPSVKNRPASIRTQPVAQTLELEETLSPDFEKQFELPLDQASRLLEESDFQEVVNKMPFEALDLFGPGKPNEADQEESDQIPLDQVSATKARDAIEKLLCGAMSEEESMQLAMVLAQNLHTDAELTQNAVALLAESAGEATPTGLDSRLNADGRGLGTGAAGGSGICGMDIQESIVVQGPNNVTIQSQQHLHGHPQSQQRQQSHDQLLRLSAQTMGMSSSAPNAIAKLGQVAFDHTSNLQFKPHQHNHLQQQQVLQNPSITSGGISFKSTGPSTSSSSSSFQDNATSSLSYMDHHHHIQHLSQSGLSVVYGQLGSLTPSQLSAKQSVGHAATSALCGPSPSYSKLAKTVIRHLPTETPPTLTQQGGLRLGSGLSVASSTGTFLKGDSNPKLMAVQQELRLDRSGNDLIQSPSSLSLSSSSSSLSSSSLSVPTMTMSTSLSSSLSLPSLAKKAKLMNPLPPPTSAMNQEIKLQQKQSQIQQLDPPSLQLKQLQHLQQSQLQHQLLASSPKGNILRSPAPRLNLTDATRSSPTLPPMVKPNPVDAHKLSLPDMHHPSLKRTDLGPQKPKFGPKTLPNAGVSKLKLTSPKPGRQDMAHTSNKLTLPTTNSVSSPVPSSSVLVRPQDTSSSLYKPIVCGTSSKSLNTVRYTLTSTNSSNSPFTNNPLQKSLLSGPLGSNSRNESPSESISVTVRHPSSLEAVPTTVRHTLPDTFPAHHSLPSSPLHFLPKSSSVASPTQSSSSPSSASSSPHRLSLDSNLKQYAPSSSISSSSSEPHSALTSQLCSPRNPWVQVQTPPTHHQQHVSGLTNGLPPPPYPKTNTNHELTSSKLNSPSSQSVPPRLTADSNLQSSGKQHHSSSSLLGPGPHMPVVCSGPVTLPGFALPLPATAFKTTGTS